MRRSRSVVGIAVGISSLVLVAAGFIAYRAVGRLASTSDAVVRAKELELSLERLLSTIRDAETGQRGYLLSGSEEYLAPYDEALAELESRLSTVEARAKARDIPDEEMRNLRALVTRKLGELARTIELNRNGRRDEALRILRSDEGKAAMDSIRGLIGARADAERANVEKLIRGESEALRQTIRANVAVSVLAIALMIVLAWVVKRDSARLRHSEERLATTLRSIGDAVIATDERGLVTLTNPVAEELTGWTLADARGRPLDEVFRIVNEQTRATVESPVTKVLRVGGIVGLANHTVLIGRDGQEVAIEDSGAPILDADGAITGVVLVFRDATEERAAQNALHAADRRKDEFLATLAHELRNPLAPIRQAAAMAGKPDATAEQIAWCHGVIERQAAHMARLLDDLLDVSRITRGRLEVRRARVELRSIVESAVETARPAIDAHRHALHVELPSAPLWVDADALRIAQVLANLLTNAAKYTPPPGEIRLVGAREGDQVVVRVADNGIGLAADDLPRIFEMFAQVKPTLDRKEGGLGIGLALSKALMELHGGSLEARSAGLGQGSEFVAKLALAQAAAGAQAGTAAADPARTGTVETGATTGLTATPVAAGTAPRAVRILLADDNRDACDSLQMLLELEHHDVRVAYDGEHAFEEIAAFRPEIALLDIGMPGMNGYELAAKIREQPWGAGIHLVAVTGWGQEDDRRRALDAGFDQHLVKPVDFNEVSALCRRVAAGIAG
ncbi:MAG TPA: CHASE3 domain-containing protein [Steroidobacteraceae bacterium]|nr:CHASE3 domain-containing protein [Steroidobacteraceae bacterium]